MMKTNCDKCGGFIVMQGKYDYAGELCSCINASSIYGVIPKGWKLVPIEPTAEMLKAAQRAEMDHSEHDDWLYDDIGTCQRRHKAMLEAAPKEPS